MATGDTLTDPELAALRDARQLPDRSTLKQLLERYLVGTVDEGSIDRLAASLATVHADGAARVAMESAFVEGGPAHFGEAWKEELSPGERRPGPAELAVWLAITTPGFPSARSHCPSAYVGRWRAVAPSAARWDLAADGKLVTDDPELRTHDRWCVHQAARGGELWLGNRGRARVILPVSAVSDDTLRFSRGSVSYTLEDASPRARSIAEMNFAMALEPCPGCGSRDVESLQLYGDGDLWTLAGPCPKCATKRARSFRTQGAPYEAPPNKPYELGAGASDLISEAQFRGELARVSATISDEPTRLAPTAWRASLAASRIALISLNELIKLGVHDREPLTAERDRIRAIAKRYTADAERIEALEARGQLD